MDVEIASLKKIVIYGVEKRKIENLVWCAATYGVNRLFWIDGYLFCLEVYEKSFEHEIKEKIFPISQVCYASLPRYTRTYEVEKGLQIPIVDVSDTKLYRKILDKILAQNKSENEGDCKKKDCDCKEMDNKGFEQFIS
ncbi:hypothetical protein DRO54_02905 [Candidatus Bathyarchaeota archaeon]|nr:MAG: hypothetical protein DRO54_02905 [Candidatus Bathyarchaeota archaeon]